MKDTKKIEVYQSDVNGAFSKGRKVPTWLKDGESWKNEKMNEEWIRIDGDLLIRTLGSNKDFVEFGQGGFDYDRCSRCTRKLKSDNDKQVNVSTGRCIKCHADEEEIAIATGKEYEPPQYKKDILIQDSFGNILMNYEEMLQQYGGEMTLGLLATILDKLKKREKKGLPVNQFKKGIIEQRFKELFEIVVEKNKDKQEEKDEHIQETL